MIVDAARAATAAASLRTWGGLVDDALAKSAVPWQNRTPQLLELGLEHLRPIPRELVHAKGWELRHAFVWRNDKHCVQRAAFGALAIEEAASGGLEAAVAGLARRETGAAAMAVQYGPKFADRPYFHSATISRTTDGEYLVIDHVLADADDGVMKLDDWLQRAGTTRNDATVLSPLEMPPLTNRRSAIGIPITAKRHEASFSQLADHLATRWSDAERNHLPQVERATVRP